MSIPTSSAAGAGSLRLSGLALSAISRISAMRRFRKSATCCTPNSRVSARCAEVAGDSRKKHGKLRPLGTRVSLAGISSAAMKIGVAKGRLPCTNGSAVIDRGGSFSGNGLASKDDEE
eukprot:90294-Prymnesium_polylepis.1